MAFAALRVMEGQGRFYRRTWRSDVISTFLSPVLFLLAMGVGLGSLVDGGAGRGVEGLPYLEFLAPGLLAATAMQSGAGEGAYPVMAGIKWRKSYLATLATPISVGDLVAGHLGWVTLKLAFVSVVFVGVMAAFGAVSVVAGMAAVPAAILTGLAFAAPVSGYAAALKNESGLASMFRFGVVPLFLFSGTFFPISQLPDWIEPLAYVTPLWHGVELCRGVAVGLPTTFSPITHIVYLAVWTAAGSMFARRMFQRRLVI